MTFRNFSLVFAVLVAAIMFTPVFAQDQPAAPEPLTITASVPSSAEAYRQSRFELTATGGTAPYYWQIGGPVLSYDVSVDEASGRYFMDVQWHNYTGPRKVKLYLTDSSRPAVRVEKEFDITLSPMNVMLQDVWTRLDALTDRQLQNESRLRDQVVPNMQILATKQAEKFLLLQQQQERTMKWVKRLTYASIALTTAVILLVGVLAWIIWRSRKEDEGGGNLSF